MMKEIKTEWVNEWWTNEYDAHQRKMCPTAIAIIIIIIIIIIFNLCTAAFKAYCSIWVRSSNFHHQGSPCVSPRKSTQLRKVELRARNVREFCLNADFHVTFRDLLHAVKLRHETDGFTSPPKEGALRIFFALNIRRLRLGANPQTWIPKASTLPLEHRSRCVPVLPLSLQITLNCVTDKIWWSGLSMGYAICRIHHLVLSLHWNNE
jgi:hypothetical protein